MKETISKAGVRALQSARSAPWAWAILDCVGWVRREKTGNPIPFKAKQYNPLLACSTDFGWMETQELRQSLYHSFLIGFF